MTVSIEHVFGDAPLFTLWLPVAPMRHDRSHRKLMNKTEGPKSTRGRFGAIGRPGGDRRALRLQLAQHMSPQPEGMEGGEAKEEGTHAGAETGRDEREGFIRDEMVTGHNRDTENLEKR